MTNTHFPQRNTRDSQISTRTDCFAATSAREGFPYWMGERMYGVKWQNFKVVLVLQETLSDPALQLATPHIVNLDVDPAERKPFNYPLIHSWVIAHAGRIAAEFQRSVDREELVPAGAPLDFVPKRKPK